MPTANISSNSAQNEGKEEKKEKEDQGPPKPVQVNLTLSFSIGRYNPVLVLQEEDRFD